MLFFSLAWPTFGGGYALDLDGFRLFFGLVAPVVLVGFGFFLRAGARGDGK